MKIDINEKTLRKVISIITKLDHMDFPEITDGNKQSDLFEIKSTLNDFAFDLVEEFDD